MENKVNTFIYLLRDPRPGKFKGYIGKSNNPKWRFKYGHLCEAKMKGGTLKKDWLRKLDKLELQPILEVIDEVPINEWQFWEVWYIELFKTWNYELVNSDKGGLGSERMSLETRQKISSKAKERFKYRSGTFKGKHHTIETKTLLSNQRKGTRLGEENSFYNKHHSDKTKKRLSEVQKQIQKEGKGNKLPVMYGVDNPSCKKRVIISPTGEKTLVTNLRKFCQDNLLSLETFRKWLNKGKILAPLAQKDIIRQRYKSKRTVGWELRDN